jgi:endonuclease YncB( thermonuclease family)
MKFQEFVKEARKLSTIFALATGVVAGGGITGYHIYQDQQNIKIEQVDTTRFQAANDNRTVVEAEVVQTAADGAVVVRAHTWVGQYKLVSVYPEGAAGDVARSVTAQITDKDGTLLTEVKKGDTVYLRHVRGPGLSGVAVDLPNVKPAGDVVAGPIQALALRVIDGDTPAVMAEVWPGDYISISVRDYGTDTPETRTKNLYEKELGKKAAEATRALIEGKQVLLYNIEIDKFGGRVLADIKTLDGIDVGQNLIGQGLARPYFGEKKEPWNPPPGWKAPAPEKAKKPSR